WRPEGGGCRCGRPTVGGGGGGGGRGVGGGRGRGGRSWWRWGWPSVAARRCGWVGGLSGRPWVAVGDRGTDRRSGRGGGPCGVGPCGGGGGMAVGVSRSWRPEGSGCRTGRPTVGGGGGGGGRGDGGGRGRGGRSLWRWGWPSVAARRWGWVALVADRGWR
ncbi:hypothetical protein Tco_1535591, partial [Tanacetum coccineum]